MSRTTAHLCRLIGLCMLAAAFAASEGIAIPAASAGQGKKLDPPTLLWKSYPLERRPSTTGRAEAPFRRRASRQTSAHQDHLLTPALVSVFTLLLASAAIVLVRRSMPIRVGNGRRTPSRAPMPRSAQPASLDRPRRRPQQLREVIPEVVREHHAPAPQSPAPQSDADLLEALQPKPPSLPRPEVAVVDLEEARPDRTPEPVEQRPATQTKLRETSDPLAEERKAEAALLSHLGLELWTRIADVPLVPHPEPTSPTHEETRAQQQTRPQRAGVEVCEIKLWRGYIKCQLRAALRRSEAVIAVSSYFRLRDEDSPGDEARLALRDLIATLEQRGWTVVSRGPTWYEDRLQRGAREPEKHDTA
jgi:hypothetical protein